MTEIEMPLLSDAMEDGTVLSWLIEEGKPVAVGDELVEIETDKATMTYSAEAAGILQIVAPEGEVVPVGQTIARLVESAAVAGPGPASEPPPAEAITTGPGANSEPSVLPEPPVPEPVVIEVESGSLATPLARRIAAAHGIPLDSVPGSGPRGRVTKLDVMVAAGIEVERSEIKPTDASISAASPQPEEETAARAPAAAKGNSGLLALTKLQTVVARRMAEAKATVPDFQVETEVVMDRAVALRAELKQLGSDRPAPSLNDMIVKASALALTNHPLANGSYKGDGFEFHERVNVGIAVAAEGSLVVPTIMDADSKPLSSIAEDGRRLASRVRSGEITPPELSGGTFTVSNLGMFGMTAITAVINLPQAAILGVGALRDVLTRDEAGEIVDRALLTLRLTCDHRILYGADAAEFLAEIKDLLQRPLSLLS